jgi:hypothetical protein
VDFCKNSPDAEKTEGDHDLDETRRPGMKEGLQIDVVHQVGPDANNACAGTNGVCADSMNSSRPNVRG